VNGVFTGDGYQIQIRTREDFIYWEGDKGFWFETGWGVEPPIILVPSAEQWLAVMPTWMRDHRDLILERIERDSGHVPISEPMVDDRYRDVKDRLYDGSPKAPRRIHPWKL
jgi:hypothetical protein